MRGILRRLFQSSDHHVFDVLGSDGDRSTRSRLIDQPLQPVFQKPLAWLGHGMAFHITLGRDHNIGQPLSGAQHDLGSCRQRLGDFARRAQPVNVVCSSTVSTHGCFGQL